MKLQMRAMIFALHIHSRQISLQEPNEALMFPLRQRARRDACNAMSRQRPPPGYLSTVSWTHEGETTYKARFVTSLHKPAMFNLVHILTGMRRSGKTFQLFQLITEYKERWASAHADAHLECPYSSAEHWKEP